MEKVFRIVSDRHDLDRAAFSHFIDDSNQLPIEQEEMGKAAEEMSNQERQLRSVIEENSSIVEVAR